MIFSCCLWHYVLQIKFGPDAWHTRFPGNFWLQMETRHISNAYKEILDIRGTLLIAGSSGSIAHALVPDSSCAGCCKCKRKSTTQICCDLHIWDLYSQVRLVTAILSVLISSLVALSRASLLAACKSALSSLSCGRN